MQGVLVLFAQEISVSDFCCCNEATYRNFLTVRKKKIPYWIAKINLNEAGQWMQSRSQLRGLWQENAESLWSEHRISTVYLATDTMKDKMIAFMITKNPSHSIDLWLKLDLNWTVFSLKCPLIWYVLLTALKIYIPTAKQCCHFEQPTNHTLYNLHMDLERK